MSDVAVVYHHWIPWGTEHINRFFPSYLYHRAGAKHDFISINRDTGWDLTHYMEVVRDTNYQRYCFFNSYSEILASDWLAKMLDAGVELAGAFGSWEGCPTHSQPFPNPHIRTNAFLTTRKILLNHPFTGQTKNDCYEYECGTLSLTDKVWQVRIVGADGTAYDIEDWRGSRTFRLGNQENLLVGDKHSRAYDAATPEERARLTELAWGRQ